MSVMRVICITYLVANLIEVIKLLPWGVQKLSPLPTVLVIKLQHQRPPGNDPGSTGEKRFPNNVLEDGGFTGGLTAEDGYLRQIDRGCSAHYSKGILFWELPKMTVVLEESLYSS